MISTSIVAALALLQAGSGDQSGPGLPNDGQDWKFTVRRPVEMRFIVSTPDGYFEEKNKKWPVILFLHGAGERGTELDKVRRHGPLKEIANGRKLPFIVIAPQIPEDEVWDPAALLALMDTAERRFRIDKEREYITGLSMGGYGTWATVAAAPKRFAAAAPICGGGGATWIAPSRLASTPIWATHGDADASVPIAEDQEVVDAVRRAHGDIRFDIIQGGGHDVWTNVYASDDLYDWFLAHTRKRNERAN